MCAFINRHLIFHPEHLLRNNKSVSGIILVLLRLVLVQFAGFLNSQSQWRLKTELYFVVPEILGKPGCFHLIID